MEDREVILDSAVDRFMLAAVNFGAELEHEKASLRSHDKARQQFLAGHVTGGVVFGYDNVKVNHYNKQACSHHDVWPVEAVDQAVLMAIGGDVLEPDAIAEIVAEARAMFEAGAADDRVAAIRIELEQVQAEQGRLADAIANGGRFPVLMSKLDATERRRVQLVASLEEVAAPTIQPPSWRAIERLVRQSLADWRALLLGDVARVRDAFRAARRRDSVHAVPGAGRALRAIRRADRPRGAAWW